MFQWLRCKCFRGRCAKCKLTSMLEQGNTSTCSSGNRISLLPPLVISPMKSPNLFGEVNPTGTPTTFHHKQPNQPWPVVVHLFERQSAKKNPIPQSLGSMELHHLVETDPNQTVVQWEVCWKFYIKSDATESLSEKSWDDTNNLKPSLDYNRFKLHLPSSATLVMPGIFFVPHWWLLLPSLQNVSAIDPISELASGRSKHKENEAAVLFDVHVRRTKTLGTLNG